MLHRIDKRFSQSPQAARLAFKPQGNAAPGGLTRDDVEAVVNAALDAKLAPIKRAVLGQSGPGVVEIVGGIGWIFGLAGVAAYFRSRPRD